LDFCAVPVVCRKAALAGWRILSKAAGALHWVLDELGIFTLKKLECSKQAYA